MSNGRLTKEDVSPSFLEELQEGGTHAGLKNNPHQVTKAQVGLGNADNTSDAIKPVSAPQRQAIDEVQSYAQTVSADLTQHVQNEYVPFKQATEAHLSELQDAIIEFPVKSVNGKVGTVQLTAYDVGAPSSSDFQTMERWMDDLDLMASRTKDDVDRLVPKYIGSLTGSINLNNVLDQGHYHINNASGAMLNIPAGVSYGVLKVYIAHTFVLQEITVVDANGGKSYYRTRSSTGTWSRWMEVMTDRNFDTLFQSVSSGKTAIANATTQKGVPTSPTAEFATMAANISSIQTGKRFYSGQSQTVTVASGGTSYTQKVNHALGVTPDIIVVEFYLDSNTSPSFKAISVIRYDRSARFFYTADGTNSYAYDYFDDIYSVNTSNFSFRFRNNQPSPYSRTGVFKYTAIVL